MLFKVLCNSNGPYKVVGRILIKILNNLNLYLNPYINVVSKMYL